MEIQIMEERTLRRRRPWPTHAQRARQQTQQAAGDHAELLREALRRLEGVRQQLTPVLSQEVIAIERDVALGIAALSDIRGWMIEVAQAAPEVERVV